MPEEWTKPAAVRPCGRCGQAIDIAKDSWERAAGGRLCHRTCPASPEMRALPKVAAVALPAVAARDEAQERIVFLTQDEAAQLIHVHVNTIRKYIHDGRLPARKMRGGRRVLIDQRDVLGLLEPVPVGADVAK